MKSSSSNRVLLPIASYIQGRPVVFSLLVVLVAACVASLVFPETADVSGLLAWVLGLTAAGIVYLRGAGRLEGRERLAWRGVGVALLVASLGVIVISVLSGAGADIPAFGPLDTFFIASYALILISILCLPHAEGRWAVRVCALLDGLVGAVAVATLAWVWFLSGYLDRLAVAPPGQRVVAMTYPILDVAILIGVLMLSTRRSTYWFDKRLLLLSVAMIFHTLGDLSFAVAGVGELFANAEPIYVLYIAAGIFMFASASIVHERPAPHEFVDRPARRIALIAPYGAATLLVVALVWHTMGSNSTHIPLLVLATVTVVVLTFARQAVSIRENRYRVEEDRQNLVSSISHELRTPLTSMFGMLEVVRAGDIDLSSDEQREFLESATDQAKYLARIVSDLVMLARDRDDDIYVAFSPCRLDELVREAVDRVVGGGGVEVRAPALMVTVDEDRLGQAVTNLVGNAVKYGHGLVSVRASVGDNLLIEVHDDGPAVPTKYELMIWNRFERGPRKLDSRVPGSGNGLAVVAKVAQAHRGRAGYRRSEILGGACFFLSIPLELPRAEIARMGAVMAPLVIAV